MLRSAAALGLALVAAGCQGSKPSPTAGAVRDVAATAPADLQLLCASAATERLGLPAGTTVLPTSSAQTADGYEVALSFTGGTATCAVGADGTVRSVARA
jgi:hypothetical protein